MRAAGRPLETHLTVRLWRNCPLSKDQIVGLASKHLQFTLFAVASLNSLETAACSCGYSWCRQTQSTGLCLCPKALPQRIRNILKTNHHVFPCIMIGNPCGCRVPVYVLHVVVLPLEFIQVKCDLFRCEE